MFDTRYKLVDESAEFTMCCTSFDLSIGPLISSTAPPGSLGHLSQPISQNHVPYVTFFSVGGIDSAMLELWRVNGVS